MRIVYGSNAFKKENILVLQGQNIKKVRSLKVTHFNINIFFKMGLQFSIITELSYLVIDIQIKNKSLIYSIAFPVIRFM